MNELVRALGQEQLKKEVPNFGPGDTVRVHVKIVEVVINYEKNYCRRCVPYEHRRSPRA